MKFSHIVPSKHLQDLDEYSGCYLMLSHLIPKDELYTAFFAQSEKFKILDNGAFENGYPEPIATLVDKAAMVKADEIVLPDVFRDAHYSKVHTVTALDYLKKHKLIGKYKLMGVPQGKTHHEYLESLKYLLAIPEIDTIGLSFIIIDECFREVTGVKGVMPNRIFLTALLDLAGFCMGKEFHLLGMENCKELTYQKKYPWIRSADSSTACVHGMHKVRFDREEGLLQKRIQKPDDYFDDIIVQGSPCWGDIIHNMEVVDGLIRMY